MNNKEPVPCAYHQSPQTCQVLTSQIAATDNEIDQRAFDLYGLTPKERETQ